MSQVETVPTPAAARPAPIRVVQRTDVVRFLSADHARVDRTFEVEAAPGADRFEMPFVADRRRLRYDHNLRLAAVSVDGVPQPADARRRAEDFDQTTVMTCWADLPGPGRHTVRFAVDALDTFPDAETGAAVYVEVRHPTARVEVTLTGGEAFEVRPARDPKGLTDRPVGCSRLTDAPVPEPTLADPVRTPDGGVRWEGRDLPAGLRCHLWVTLRRKPAPPADPLGPDQRVQFDALTRYSQDRDAGRLDDVIGQYVAYTDTGRLLAASDWEGLLERAAAAAGVPAARVVVEFVG